MSEFGSITMEKIKAAQKQISDIIIRTPLLKLDYDDAPAEIYLKLENLQPTGSFKIRGVSNAMRQIKPEELKDGVYAFSSGNKGRGIAYNAKRMGIKCTIWTTDETPPLKIRELERLGAEVKIFPYTSTPEGWQRIQEIRAWMKGLEITGHDSESLAGYGTIGLEILEDLPDVDTILMPFGSGILCSGLSSGVRVLNPRVKM
jgi:threonine dehydratase